MSRYTVTSDYTKKVKRFNLYGRVLEFEIRAIPKEENPVEWIKRALIDIFNDVSLNLRPTDKIGFTFCSKDYAGGPGYLKFKNVEEVYFADVWDLITKIYQSNSKGFSTETFCLRVTTVRMPTGKGNRRIKYNSFDEECSKRKGIVPIKNKDNLCLPRALVVALAHINKDAEYKKIRSDSHKIQLKRAEELIVKADVSIPEEGCGIPELQKFQNFLRDYQIVVYKYGEKGREVLYRGPQAEKHLNLLHHNNHFNVIISLTAAFSCSYFCKDCLAPYNNKNQHRCSKQCPCCQHSPPCPRTVEDILCEKCNRLFRGATCFKNHEQTDLCQKIKRCRLCLETTPNDREHICGEIFCKICKRHVPTPHFCFIQPDNRQPNVDKILFVFFDLETRQEDDYNDAKIHSPNLCVFQQRCSVCMDDGDEKTLCNACGVRRQILKSNNPIPLFVEYVINMRKIFKQVIVLAHNGQAFDNQFILKYILEKTDLKPELIMRGTKIILLQVQNVKFLDSLNYFPMKLSALPKAFGFTELKKGYFPHLFNTLKNQDYVGPYPDAEFYDPDSMTNEDRKKFLKWYKQRTNDKFDFQKEFVEYCVSDVQILMEACLRFRKIMLEECNVCPFTEAATIASACNLVFRRNFLKSDSIGVIPKNGYRLRDNQSKIALLWLIYQEQTREIDISHAAKGSEVVLHGVKVDGYCLETNQVFEFHGCYYHGCPKCFIHKREAPLHENSSDSLQRRYELTLMKTERLKSFGYEVIEQWQCEIGKELDHLNNHSLLNNLPLQPRDAFYGGRTGNTMSYYKCKENEKIKYVDVCSLYPWACKYGKFPIKHPKIIVGEERDLKNLSGLVKCTILPPQQLFHPILPVKMNNKLMFVLCRTCGEEMNNSNCEHSENERALTGTWVIEEVNEAIKNGYTLVKTYEIWEYETVQKNGETEGLFTEMMNKFLKIKQEASGWPVGCYEKRDKEAYIRNFQEHEGIHLEFEKIEKNPGLRTLAKLILNSFWGKFGQRENQSQTKIINEPYEFFDMLTNASIEVNTAVPVNENTIVVTWNYKDEASEPLPMTNVVIASYVTAIARSKLLSYLNILQSRSIYFDTDSCIFISREGEPEPTVGNFIGDLTDEIQGEYGPESFITEFVCGGPKNYAYRVYSPQLGYHTMCKVKGISLNYKNSQIINFESIKRMILNNDEDHLPVNTRHFRRTEDHSVITINERKIYQPTLCKRRFFEDHTSLPYGYKKIKISEEK